MESQRVLLLGLDGACFSMIEPLVKQGKLPTFKNLLEEGVQAYLKSTIPPTTIPAWLSMFTGLNQGKLGCFGQQLLEKSSYELKPISISSWKGKLIWDIVSEKKKVGIFNIPTLSRSYPINGYMIRDILSGSVHDSFYPADLVDEFEGHLISQKVEDLILPTTKIKVAFYNFKKRLRVANYLLKHKKTDLFIMITRIPDIISHFTTNLRKVTLAYRVIDEELSKLLDLAKKIGYNIIIVSDHGTGQRIDRRFSVNAWLLANGFLAMIEKETGTLNQLADKLMKLLMSRGFSPLLREVDDFLKRKLGKEIYSSLEWEKLIRWESTKAFAYGGEGTNYTGIKIHCKELFSKGIVSFKEYEDLRNQLCNKLKEYKDPQSGSMVIDEIFKKDQIFHGHNTSLVPDLILKAKKNYKVISSFESSILSSEKDLIHTQHGIFIANGPIFREGVKIGEIDIKDIAPTILHIFDIPIPKDMDGKVLKTIFKKKSQFIENEIRYQEPMKIKEHVSIPKRRVEEIKDRLRALGYLE